LVSEAARPTGMEAISAPHILASSGRPEAFEIQKTLADQPAGS
jgi:hypothetical protein